MPAYIIAQIQVHDPREYRRYQLRFINTSKPFGCRVLVATDDMEVLEGEWPKVRNVILECPSIERAKEWYKSEQYQSIIQHRLQSSITNMILVDGFSER